MGADDYRIREATDADLDAVVAVGQAALGWDASAPNRRLFEWKHVHNAFGRSPIWVAERGDEVAGFRAFMRWSVRDGSGQARRVVRAVDTATHPDHQRQGIFSKLARHGLDAMAAEGVDWVFNTPNDQSRPGYLKLGWVTVGRLPLRVRPTGVGALPKMARARVPAEKWSEVVDTGVDAAEAMRDEAFAALAAGAERPAGRVSTDWTADALRWRYGLAELRYRVWAPDGLDAGAVVFRVRRRGPARECVVAAVMAPGGSRSREAKLVRSLARAVDADYLALLGDAPLSAGAVAVPRLGPLLTARTVSTDPPIEVDQWALALGDVELF